MSYCVYLLEDCNGFGYIGSTCNLHRRLIQHKCNNNSARSKLLAKPFTHLVLEEFENEDDMEVAEQFYIKLYKYLYGDKLLNITIPLRTKKEYRVDNKDKLSQINKEWYNNNKERVIERVKNYAIENKDEILEKNKKRYIKNRDKVLEKHKEYRVSNREKVLEQRKNWYYENKDTIKQYRSREIECECGSTFKLVKKSRHIKTKKHQNFLNSQSS